MQLHSLSITAFGPFADTQHVDFDALAASGLFLFHGPTGAGKTSILDAVCFAFYGRVPGARFSGRNLRSDHARPDTKPMVVLEATVRGQRLRLTRSPEWQRPKKRGTGTTTEQARVHLQQEVAGEWTTVSLRLDETGDEVQRRLGLTMTQFCQVVMLPQGQFAEFLRAGSDDRRALLEGLFDTKRFSEVERWLVERRKESTRALEQVDLALAEVLARVAQASGATTAPDTVSSSEATDWVAALVAEAANTVDRLEWLSEPLDRRRDEAALARGNGQQLREQRNRHDALQHRLANITSSAARQSEVVAELQAARQAAPVLPLVVEVARLDETLALASGEVRVHQQRLAELGSSIQAVAGGPAMLRSQVDRTQAELGALEHLLDDESEARELSTAIERLTREVVSLAQEREKVTRWLTDAIPRLPRMRQAVEDAQRAGDRCAAAESTVAALVARLAAAKQRDALDQAVSAGRDVLRDAIDFAQARKAAWLDARTARIQGMAAELAATLSDESACPVCGSQEHPAPARGFGRLVTRQDEQTAERAAAAADGARGTAEAGLGVLMTQRAVAAAAASDSAVAAVETALTEASGELGRLTDQASSLPMARDELAVFEAEAEQHTQEQLRLDALQLATNERAGHADERLQRLQARLDTARGDDPSVSERRARLTALVEDLAELVVAVTDVERLGREVAAARDRAAEAAERHGLTGLDDVVASSRPEPVVVELEEFRRRHDEELAALSEMLADESLVAAMSAPAPDLAELTGAAAAADRAYTEHVTRLSAGRDRAAQLATLAQRLTDVLNERAPIAERHAVVDGLSRLAEGKSGDNRLRMSLSGYVLTARLEQVAAAASERLERMSSGRYRLTHVCSSGAGRDRGGLNLRVRDAWTGADRDPATLSGGETFSASLALALGLADVVTAEVGGTLLDTLFVDEGFGSLDDDTLDEVMGVLDELREGGRVVGLVSHVADLRHRIPVQLSVDKGRTGSTIRQ